MDIVSTPFSFNYTAYDQNDSLLVSFSVYDLSGSNPALLGTVVGVYAGFGVYTGQFVGVPGKTYLVIGAVYMDNSYTIPDPDRSPGADCFQMVSGSVVLLAFNYAAYDQASDLNIRATVYDNTTGTPVSVGTVEMPFVAIGVYAAKFTGQLGKNYIIASVVYTDNTFATVDPNRAPGCDNFDCITLGVTNVLASAVLIGQSTEAILEGSCA